jgi:hypothetical protein
LCWRYHGPSPSCATKALSVIALAGEQGSANSSFSAILEALVDPSVAPLRALPREDRDLFIGASNGHVLAFDNVSGLPAWISDTLCRLATGGGFAVRQLYTDRDEVLFDAVRPVILNGIEDVVTRPDLADRALFLTLEPIPEKERNCGPSSRPRTRKTSTRQKTRAMAQMPVGRCSGKHSRQLPREQLETHFGSHFGNPNTACAPAFGHATNE